MPKVIEYKNGVPTLVTPLADRHQSQSYQDVLKGAKEFKNALLDYENLNKIKTRDKENE